MNKKIVFIILLVILTVGVVGYSFFNTKQEAIIEFDNIKNNPSVDYLKDTVITYLGDGICEIKNTNPYVEDCIIEFMYDYNKGSVVNNLLWVHYIGGSPKKDIDKLVSEKVEKELKEVLQPSKIVYKDIILSGAKI